MLSNSKTAFSDWKIKRKQHMNFKVGANCEESLNSNSCANSNNDVAGSNPTEASVGEIIYESVADMDDNSSTSHYEMPDGVMQPVSNQESYHQNVTVRQPLPSPRSRRVPNSNHDSEYIQCDHTIYHELGTVQPVSSNNNSDDQSFRSDIPPVLVPSRFGNAPNLDLNSEFIQCDYAIYHEPGMKLPVILSTCKAIKWWSPTWSNSILQFSTLRSKVWLNFSDAITRFIKILR